MTTTITRADDARLHEMLTGEKPFVCDNVVYNGELVTRHGGWCDLPIPRYHEDANDARRAELALPPALQADYASELDSLITHRLMATFNADVDSGLVIDYTALYALITATAQQRAQALVAVLERARAKEVVK